MNGPKAIIDRLNLQIVGERTAFNQYVLNAQLLREWGYSKLAEHYTKEASEERGHLERLLQRVFRLSGNPSAAMIADIEICIPANAKDLFENVLDLENGAIDGYNAGIEDAVKAGDGTTRRLFEDILGDEDNHVRDVETALARIEDLGYDNYMQGWL